VPWLASDEQAGLMASDWFYCSFADEERFRGAVLVIAPDVVTAAMVATVLGINPGGEVLGMPCPQDPPERWRNRLLTLDDLVAFDAEMDPGSTN